MFQGQRLCLHSWLSGRLGCWCLNKRNEWIHNPKPSVSRTFEFLRCQQRLSGLLQVQRGVMLCHVRCNIGVVRGALFQYLNCFFTVIRLFFLYSHTPNPTLLPLTYQHYYRSILFLIILDIYHGYYRGVRYELFILLFLWFLLFWRSSFPIISKA